MGNQASLILGTLGRAHNRINAVKFEAAKLAGTSSCDHYAPPSLQHS